MAANPEGERPIRLILQDIVSNLQAIVRLEVQLAKAELKDEATRFSRASAWVVVGGALALYSVGFLLLAAVYALSDFIRPWEAAGIVALVIGAVAASLVVSGVRRVSQVDLKPERTIRSLKEDVKWVKDQSK